jgi:parallel beta-helix repeat protein
MKSCLTSTLLRAARALALLLFVGAIAAPAARAQLSGSYTIGSGGTYASFAAAVTALTSSGVSGAVTFNVISGTYTEQVTVPAITGASAANTITFQSQSGNPADVTLRFTPTVSNNYVVYLNGADYVAFKKMTVAAQGAGSYGTVFRLAGDANFCTISGNVITGIVSNSSSLQWADITVDNQPVDNLTIDANTITNGSYGVHFEGVNTTTRSDGTVVTNNTMSNFGYSAIYLHSQNSPIVNGNSINGTGSRGIEMYYCQNDISIQKNTVINAGSNGLILQYSNGGTGFPPQGLIANNVFQSGSNGAGIYLYQCTNQYVYYNSVNITGTNSSGYYGYSNAASVSLLNNVFSNMGGYYASYIYSSSETMDYNDLFTTGNFLGRLTNTEVPDLAGWQSATGKELNSISCYPNFTSATDLHSGSSFLNGKAVPVPEVTTDIDGQARNGSTPDIGADEYTPSVGAPLSGSYSVGAAQTFTTFRAAANALMTRGVSGPVTFNVINGTYNDHFVLYNVPGSNESNTITFQSSTNVTSGVTLVFNAAAPESNYVVQLVNADYVKFHKMTLRSNNNTGAAYSIVFYLRGGVDNFTLDSCNVFGYSAANSSLNYALVYADGIRGGAATFSGNTFNNGGTAIYWDGYANGVPTSGTVISGNTFLSPAYSAVYLRYHDRPQLTGNTVTGSGNRGFEIQYCHNDLVIAKNKITGVANYGLILQYSNGGTGFPPQGLVANNFIQVGGNSYGIHLYQCTNEFVYNNSVNVTGGSSQAYYGYNNNASNSVQNNIFANFGGGYAAYVYSSSESMDYNDFFTTGNFVGRLTNTEYPDLAAWQSGTGKETNGVSVYPNFTSSSNLHTGSTFLNAKGAPLAEVFDDIDGDVRDGATPDIGADEYTPVVQPPLSGSYTVGAGQTFTNFRSAASALMSRGVSGPVTFNVLNATYNEHITLYTIPGASESNTVTFQSNTNIATGVTLVFNAAAPESNYVVQLINADYVKFHKMTLRANNNTGASYSIVFYLRGGVDNFTLDSCNVFGYSAANSSLNYTLVYADGIRGGNTTINGNTFTNGGTAFYWDGYAQAAPTPGTVLTGNTFVAPAYSAVYLRYHDRPVLTGNTVNGSGNRGFELQYCNNDLVVTKNKITGIGNYGILLQYSNGGSGFPPQGLVANNFIQTGANSYGFYLYQCTNQFIYHNSVNVTGGNSQAYYGYNNAASVALRNNSFANFGGGYAANIYSTSETMDYNNLFTIGNFVGRLTNTDYGDLAAWQAGSGRDVNSVSYNPGYLSATNLHSGSHWIDGRGLALAEVTDDIDGEPRDGSTPDVGADEFTPDPLTVPLAGAYTIGAGGSFANFHAAANALNLRGVSEPVTFNVIPGTYQESITFYPVAGSSEANSITFQSQNGVAGGTILSAITTAESSFVALFYAADHFRFKNMSFRSNTNVGAQYGINLYLSGNVDDLLVDHCNLTGPSTANSNGNFSLIYSGNAFTHDLVLTNNTFNDGGYGFNLDGAGTTVLSTGTVIAGNTFNNPDWVGGFIRYHDAPQLRGNTVINADGRGFDIQYCMNSLTVTKNRIITDGGSASGIYLQYCTGTLGNPGLVANNFVTGTGPNSAGINIYGSNYQRVINNSVNMTSSSSEALYVYSGSSNTTDYLNNNWVNSGGGYSIYVISPEGIGLSDNNNHYTTGATLAYWSGNRTALADLQSASTKEASSRSVAPGYYSATNLHSIAAGLDSAGTPSAFVTDDIDGDPRDANKPDIGADEYSLIVSVGTALPGGWNMISLQVTPADFRKSVLFPTAVSSSFAYEPPAGYVVRDTLRSMVGYWLKFPSAQLVSVTGAPVLKDSAQTRAGWNLIGAIGSPVPRTSVLQVPAANVSSSYFEYVVGSGYVTADTLKPGRAFWVKTNTAGKLILDVAVVPPKPLVYEEAGQADALRGLNALTFQPVSGAAGSAAPKLYFGAKDPGAVSLDAYDLPPAPPVDAADVRFTSGRYVEFLSGASARELPIAVQGQGASYRMSYAMNGEDGLNYVLVEQSGAKITHEVPLRGTGAVTVSSAKRYAVRIQELPASFSLAQNYPNPFNPTTSIRFDLPEASTVTLKVYSLLGQELAVPLASASMERGAHVVTIDARSWASGTYLYRLQAVDAAGRALTATRKMVLMK